MFPERYRDIASVLQTPSKNFRQFSSHYQVWCESLRGDVGSEKVCQEFVSLHIEERLEGNINKCLQGSYRTVVYILPKVLGPVRLWSCQQRRYDMNGIFQMQGGKNRFLPK